MWFIILSRFVNQSFRTTTTEDNSADPRYQLPNCVKPVTLIMATFMLDSKMSFCCQHRCNTWHCHQHCLGKTGKHPDQPFFCVKNSPFKHHRTPLTLKGILWRVFLWCWHADATSVRDLHLPIICLSIWLLANHLGTCQRALNMVKQCNIKIESDYQTMNGIPYLLLELNCGRATLTRVNF
jgi:hypothetical protein